MKRIMIDPGHGGGDPGAINKNLNVSEKTINLMYATKIYNYLKENYVVEPYLTRNSDVALTLKDRVDKSNRLMVDRFISIHCNSYSNDEANGMEIWVYDKNTNENFANDIITQMNKNVKLKSRGVKENKQFYVTRYTKCKACLIELGFISNINDSKYIQDNIDLYVKTICEGIANNMKLQEKENKCNCECHK